MPQREVTALSPQEEQAFQRWVQANKITDVDASQSFYDYRGYWKEAGNRPVRFGVDHFPDTYKQHGHPTFSIESKYSKGPKDGGRWNGDTYVPQAPNALTDDELLTIADEDMGLIGKLTAEERQRRLTLLDARTRSQGPSGGAASRFGSGLLQNLNPLTMASTAYNAVRHPIATTGALLESQLQELRKSRDDVRQGRYSEAVGHGAAGLLPIFGPPAAAAGETIAAGNIAGGLGQGAGLLAPFAAKPVMQAMRGTRGASPAVLEQAAVDQVAGRVLAPGNAAFRGRAQNIAPEILRRGLTGGREELRGAADAGMADAGARIDAGYQAAGGPTTPIPITQVLSDLQQAIADLSMRGQPIAGAESRVAALQERVAQLQNVSTATKGGPVIPFEDLRKFRDEQYRLADEARGYERQGNPIKADAGYAAREAGSAVRRQFAEHSPQAAAANADYAFYKTLGDVLDPAVGRPKATAPPTGVTGGARTSGAVAGMMLGPQAAFVMSVVLPWLKNIRSEPGWLLADAQSKMKLAAAIRAGNLPAARKWMATIGEIMPRPASTAAVPMAAGDPTDQPPTIGQR